MKTDHDPLGILGTTVDDKYRVVELAGTGGFSAVYRAEHLVWREPVALKFFTLLRDAGEQLREHLHEDFIQEGKLMSQLSSRCAAIVQARDVGRLALEDGRWIPFMVLEWFDGASLDRVLAGEVGSARPPRSLSEAMALLEPVAEALEVAHQGNIAHRDLKPANIVIAGDARATEVPVKVLDFGIAKVMADHQELQEQLTRTGQQMSAFTPTYGAPEQFSRTFGATGPWTDVYAMALILVELVRGGAPALEGGTLFELGAASCHPDQRPTPGHWQVDLGDEIEAVFQRALALRCKERYPTMGAFWSELHELVHPGAGTWARGKSAGAEPTASAPDRGTGTAVFTPSDHAARGEALPFEDRLETGPTEAMPGSLPPDLAAERRSDGATATAVTATTPPPNKAGRPTAAVAGALAIGVIGVAIVLWVGGPSVQPEGSAALPAEVGTSGVGAAPAVPPQGAVEPAPETAADDTPASPVAQPSPLSPTVATTVSAGPLVAGPGHGPPPTSTQPARAQSSAAPPVAKPKASGADPFNPDSWGGRR